MLEFLLSIVAAAIALAKFIISGKLLKIFPPPVRPIVEVSQGKLRGVTTTLPNGSTYHYFKGVPYAKPPVGEIRFRPPVPIEKFYKPVVDCLVDRSVCMQPMGRFVVGKEAGLYLNVFTPGLPVGEVTTAPKFPVMVWIHGGAFMSGSNNSFVYNPLHLVEEAVVVVTLNYRLGALGFLSLPGAGITGNAGLKDQVKFDKYLIKHKKNDKLLLVASVQMGKAKHFTIWRRFRKYYYFWGKCWQYVRVFALPIAKFEVRKL